MGSSGYWEIRTYECGALGEKTKYWVPGEPPARGRKLGRSSERKQRQNENDAVRRLNREIHANFSAGDLFLGLDYGPKKYSVGIALLIEVYMSHQKMVMVDIMLINELKNV